VLPEMDEKLIELVRKCEELYDMANKKYSDSLWKETLWGQICLRYSTIPTGFD
jgi:hypothetical protein